LYRARCVVCFVFGSECAFSHDTKGIGGTNFDDALRRLLAEDDILRLNPPDGRGELICEQLNEQRVRELLLDLGTHGDSSGDGGPESKQSVGVRTRRGSGSSMGRGESSMGRGESSMGIAGAKETAVYKVC
jgi:hypothetical protein